MGEAVEDLLQLNDLALADSFINFDYVPDTPSPRSDPIAIGSGSSQCNNIEEAIEKISLIGIGGKGNDEIRVEITADNESERFESDSATSTSNSDCDEEDELEEGEIQDSDAFDEDDSEDGGGDIYAANGLIRSKNELEILPLVPAVNVTSEPHHQMLPVGVIMSILGNQVIVEGVEKHDPLNQGSILWMTDSRTPLGLIDEIFGPVKYPYYLVRYNSENEVPEGINVGTFVSFVPEFANYVLNNKDLYKKGYDTSGLYDEEVSDEAEFSDDEKEAEYKRMQRMTKRTINHQNSGKRENNRKKVPPKDDSMHTFPVAPATPLLDQGHCSPFSDIAQGLCGATHIVPPKECLVPTFPVAPASSLPDHGHCSPFGNIRQGICGVANIVPPFSPAISGPHLTSSGVWTNGTTLPLQQSGVLSNGFPANGGSWHLNNTQFPHQLPVPGIPFQQQLNPSHGFPPATIFPGVLPNILAQLMHAQGPTDQNQIPLGLSSPISQTQPPTNLQTSSFPGNHYAPHQFNLGAYANHGRKPFHRGCRKGSRPAQ